MQFLMGLHDSYSAICGKILLMNPLISVRQAYSSILQEERQRILSSTHTTSDSCGSATMVVRNSSSTPTRNFSGGSARSKRFDHSYGLQDLQSKEKSLENFNRGHRFHQDRCCPGSDGGHPYCS
jgi:hypothetical protein